MFLLMRLANLNHIWSLNLSSVKIPITVPVIKKKIINIKRSINSLFKEIILLTLEYFGQIWWEILSRHQRNQPIERFRINLLPKQLSREFLVNRIEIWQLRPAFSDMTIFHDIHIVQIYRLNRRTFEKQFINLYCKSNALKIIHN